MIQGMWFYFSQYRFLWNEDSMQLLAWYYLFYAIPYVAFALAASSGSSVLWKGYSTRRKIQAISPTISQIVREVFYSLLTVAIFSVVALYMLAASRIHDRSVIYYSVSERGWSYLIFSLVLMIVLHDAYFYWTHRLMHLPYIFRPVHRTHHRSRTPTAWAAYEFSPAEALVQALFVPLFTWWFPIYWLVFVVFLLHMIFRVVQIHCGMELMPRGVIDRPLLGLLTTTTHHDLHHRRMSGNYGLYFTWWDRLMGTEIPNYRAEFLRYAATRTDWRRGNRGSEPHHGIEQLAEK
jgi:sterol desaturase/sphingolipid hydroxylase (fatty acid hydroxylase superfamily)